jgi:general secretion pathway protein J
MAAQRMAIPQQATRGFTLIEVLVAISVMALMSLMAWRGLDGMLRSQSSLQSRSDEIRSLQTGLAQWQTDLDQLAELNGTPSWDWNGQVLRLTRRTADAPLPNSAQTPTPTRHPSRPAPCPPACAWWPGHGAATRAGPAAATGSVGNRRP